MISQTIAGLPVCQNVGRNDTATQPKATYRGVYSQRGAVGLKTDRMMPPRLPPTQW